MPRITVCPACAQAGAGGASSPHTTKVTVARRKRRRKLGSDFTAENSSVSYQVTNPLQLSFGKILVEVNLTGNAEFCPQFALFRAGF